MEARKNKFRKSAPTIIGGFCLASVAASFVCAGAIVGFNESADNLNRELADKQNLDRRLYQLGISRGDVSDTSNRDDINGDGIADYHIYLKQPNGAYAPKVILGVK